VYLILNISSIFAWHFILEFVCYKVAARNK